MEMTQESLVANGYTQEQAQQIIEAHKAAITGNFIPKARFDEVNTQLANVNTQLQERDTQIEGLRQFEGTATELQGRVDELITANQNKDNEMREALEKERKVNAMKLKLMGKVHDVDLVLSQIDQSKVSRNESGELSGFDDQLESLKESKQFLFVAETQQQNPLAGFFVKGATPPDGGNPAPGNDNPADAYGKALAQKKLAAQKQAETAQKHYF